MAAAGDTETLGIRKAPLQINDFVMFKPRELFNMRELITDSCIDRQFQPQKAD